MNKTLITLIIGWALLWGPLLLSAQAPPYWHLGEADGLPNGEIYGLYQAKNGYLWIATDGGLCRYDGHELDLVMPSPEQRGISVNDIQESSDGRIWYRTFFQELFYLPPDSLCPRPCRLPDGKPLGTYYKYHILRDTLHILSKGIHYRCDLLSEQWTQHPIPSTRTHKQRSPPSSLMGTDGCLYIINSHYEFWTQQAQQSRYIGIFPPEFGIERYIVPFRNDSVIIYTRNKIYLNVLSESIHLHPSSLLVEGIHINNVLYKKGKLWVLTHSGVLVYQSTTTGTWTCQYHLLPHESIGSCHIDREGNVWLGTLGSGLYCIPSLKLTQYTFRKKGAPSKIHCLVKGPEQHLLLGMQEEVQALHFPSGRITKRFPAGKHYVYSILYDHLYEQLLYHAYGTYVASWRHPNQWIKCKRFNSGRLIAFVNDRQILVGSRSGVQLYTHQPVSAHQADTASIQHSSQNFRHNKPSIERYDSVRPSPLHANYPLKASVVDGQDSTHFWLFINDTLWEYQDHQRRPIPLPSLPGYPTVQVDAMDQAPDGTIWITTLRAGLYSYRDGVAQHRAGPFSQLPRATALQCTHHQVWIGGNNGLLCYRPLTEQVDHYNYLDGFPRTAVNALEIVNGDIFAATDQGLIRLDTGMVSTNTTPPLLLPIQAQLRDTLPLEDHSQLLYTQNTLTFRIGVIALKSRGQAHYEYRVWGLDTTWTAHPSSNRNIRLAGLSPGSYALEVRARNEDGVYSTSVQRWSWTILPPFWATMWFRLGLGLIVLLSLGSLGSWWFYRTQKRAATQTLIAQLKLQALQSQMNPHFIFNAMSIVQSYWMHQPEAEALRYHSKFARLMRLIFEYSSREVILLEKEQEFLELYIELERLRLHQPVDVHWEWDESLDKSMHTLPPLLLQPLVENCFKHGLFHRLNQSGNIWIRFRKQDAYLLITIEDDGIGRTAAAPQRPLDLGETRTHSISIIRERLQVLHQQWGKPPLASPLLITDLLGTDGQATGTRVEVWIPFYIY